MSEVNADHQTPTQMRIRCGILADRLLQECDRITYTERRTKGTDGSMSPTQRVLAMNDLEQKYATMRVATREWIDSGADVMDVRQQVKEASDRYLLTMTMLNEKNTARSQSSQQSLPPTERPRWLPQHECQFCPAAGSPTGCIRNQDALTLRRWAADTALCFNCLQTGHEVNACPSQRTCSLCGKSHHRLLHVTSTQYRQLTVKIMNDPIVTQDPNYTEYPKFRATAVVDVLDVDGVPHRMRAFLDLGAVMSLISQEAARQLRLPRTLEDIGFVGVNGANSGHGMQSVALRLCDRHRLGYELDVRAFVKARLTGGIWQTPVPLAENWPHVGDLVLADPAFMDRRPFDILLGSDVYGRLLRPGLRQMAGMPTAQNTIFGWVVSGVLTKDGYEGIYGRPEDRVENEE